MDLTVRQDLEEELDVSRFPWERIWDKLMLLAETPRPNISSSVRELSHRTIRI